MCGSMADIQSAAAEITRGKKEERTNDRMKIQNDHKQFHRNTILLCYNLLENCFLSYNVLKFQLSILF